MVVQVEDFGLPKSAVDTVGQTSKMFRILTLDFQAVQVEDFGMPCKRALREYLTGVPKGRTLGAYLVRSQGKTNMSVAEGPFSEPGLRGGSPFLTAFHG